MFYDNLKPGKVGRVWPGFWRGMRVH